MSRDSLTAGAAAVAIVLATGPALADVSIIKSPGAHADYLFEAEPHALVAPFDGFHPGVGFRGTFSIVHNGFISSINNSVGIGIGADWSKDHFRIPVVMQWNFWLSRNWSVFGEPGTALRFQSGEGVKNEFHIEPLQMFVGGRFHFSDTFALTMRMGYPTFSIGTSFLL